MSDTVGGEFVGRLLVGGISVGSASGLSDSEGVGSTGATVGFGVGNDVGENGVVGCATGGSVSLGVGREDRKRVDTGVGDIVGVGVGIVVNSVGD